MQKTKHKIEVISPLGKVIFSEVYGIVKDPFGILIQLLTSFHDKNKSRPSVLWVVLTKKIPPTLKRDRGLYNLN